MTQEVQVAQIEDKMQACKKVALDGSNMLCVDLQMYQYVDVKLW